MKKRNHVGSTLDIDGMHIHLNGIGFGRNEGYIAVEAGASGEYGNGMRAAVRIEGNGAHFPICFHHYGLRGEYDDCVLIVTRDDAALEGLIQAFEYAARELRQRQLRSKEARL